jgi:hypothetical protein
MESLKVEKGLPNSSQCVAKAAAEDSTSETVDSTAASAAERAAREAKKIAAATTAAATAPVTPQWAWVREPRGQKTPGVTSGVPGDSSWPCSSPEEREPVDVCSRSDSHAGAVTRAATGPSADDSVMDTSGEPAPAAEERTGVEERAVVGGAGFPATSYSTALVQVFSSHPRRVLCTFFYSGNREIWNGKYSDCYRIDRKEFEKQIERKKERSFIFSTQHLNIHVT